MDRDTEYGSSLGVMQRGLRSSPHEWIVCHNFPGSWCPVTYLIGILRVNAENSQIEIGLELLIKTVNISQWVSLP